MPYDHERRIAEAVQKHLLPWGQAGWDYHPLLQAAAKRKFVLIGESTHGTAEFYRIRADITRHLIQEKGYDAVAVEADWPDAWRVNRYVCNRSDDPDAVAALGDFERFPTWMWRNTEVSGFVEWLQDFNETERRGKAPVCFYGLDLYSMRASVAAVVGYLERVDPLEAALARERYACFDHFIYDAQAYGLAAISGALESCESQVVDQLMSLHNNRLSYAGDDDEYFSVVQNAEVIKKAEEYYRSMYFGRSNTWNLRETHMFATAENLSRHLSKKMGREARIVIWAHNSHLGDASATEMGARGDISLGSLIHNRYGSDSLAIGFSTSRGTVTAADDWDAPAKTKALREPLAGSYEEMFSRMNEKQFFLDLREQNESTWLLQEERLQRAIGVIYRPQTERKSHYFRACLPEQFDFNIHIDKTEALEPLPSFPHREPGEMDETYPSGL